MKFPLGVFLTALLLALSCSADKVTPPAFDGDRAFGYLQKQVSFGPRVPGSIAWRLCREYFYHQMHSLRLRS